jgi:MoxR-like ATPase
MDWSKLRTAKAERREEACAEALAELAVTDWYVIRAADPSDGLPIPEDVIARRRAARAVLREDDDA